MPVSSFASGTVTTTASGRSVTRSSFDFPSIRRPAGPWAMKDTCAGARALRAAVPTAGRTTSRTMGRRGLLLLIAMVDSSAATSGGRTDEICRSEGESVTVGLQAQPEAQFSSVCTCPRTLCASGRVQRVPLLRKGSGERDLKVADDLPGHADASLEGRAPAGARELRVEPG